MKAKLSRGNELCCVIEEVVDLEWRKYRSRTIEINLKNGEKYSEDHSRLPPYTTIRFRNEDPDFVTRLQKIIGDYHGIVRWNMQAFKRVTLPGVNWVIRPVFVDEKKAEAAERGFQDVDRYIAENYPEFSPSAYDDLIDLSAYVERELSK